MGGRGGKSRMAYAEYSLIGDANAAMGYGNGGEADQWTKALSKEEKRAINNYSRRGYDKINGTLRRLKDGKDVDPNTPVGKRITAMEDAIDRYNLDRPTVFTR